MALQTSHPYPVPFPSPNFYQFSHRQYEKSKGENACLLLVLNLVRCQNRCSHTLQCFLVISVLTHLQYCMHLEKVKKQIRESGTPSSHRGFSVCPSVGESLTLRMRSFNDWLILRSSPILHEHFWQDGPLLLYSYCFKFYVKVVSFTVAFLCILCSPFPLRFWDPCHPLACSLPAPKAPLFCSLFLFPFLCLVVCGCY